MKKTSTPFFSTKNQFFKNIDTFFLDFDGVIKDSNTVKSVGFEDLFRGHGKEIVNAIKVHHSENMYLSRFEKIPLYLSWTREPVTRKNIKLYCDKFSLLVKLEEATEISTSYLEPAFKAKT